MSIEGKLIVIECPDTVLRDQIIEHLYLWLRSMALAVEQTREPTRGPIGAQIVLAQHARLQLPPACLALLRVADRLDHLRRQEGILVWLAEGRTVLCAGYLLDALARQWDELDPDWLLRINDPCPAPDQMILIKLRPRPPGQEYLIVHMDQAAAFLQDHGYEIAMLDEEGSIDATLDACRRQIASAWFRGCVESQK